MLSNVGREDDDNSIFDDAVDDDFDDDLDEERSGDNGPESAWSDMDKGSKFSAVGHFAENGFGKDADAHKLLDDPKAEIRRLNNRLRRTGVGGMTCMTAGVMGLPPEIKVKCMQILQLDHAEDEHNPNNDPYNEQDFGTIEYEGHILLWKIDYYDLDMMHHSPDPADEAVTKRVLTIMLASEY